MALTEGRTNEQRPQSNIRDEVFIEFRKHVEPIYAELASIEGEEFLTEVAKRVEATHNLCKSLSEQNKAVAELLASNPRLYLFIQELLKETPVRVALVKSDLADIAPFEDDDDFEEYNRAVEQSRERRAELKRRAHERVAKCEQCGEIANEFYTENQIDQEDVEKFVEFFEKIIEDIFDANIDKRILEVLWKAFSYDNEVSYARAQGVIDGKNEIINNRRRQVDDTLPSSSSRFNASPEGSMGYIERLLSRKFQ